MLGAGDEGDDWAPGPSSAGTDSSGSASTRDGPTDQGGEDDGDFVISPPAMIDDLAAGTAAAPMQRLNDRYALRRLLGRGGFATVYEAWDEVLHRTVAVKVPRREKFATRKLLDAFIEEARTTARLRHRLIVTVHDAGWAPDGMGFIVLDYVDGGTLTQALRKGAFEWRRTASLIAEVADAVAYANRQGLVHRDLKPSNILLDSQGQPYVSDFGLAAFEDSHRLRDAGVAGTPPFMAPEQVRGENHRLDGRTDQWALGVILYRMLTGRLPFQKEHGDYADEILHRDPRPPRQIDERVPKELERICFRCLAKRMSDRYPSCSDMALDLRAWLARTETAVGTEVDGAAENAAIPASAADSMTRAPSAQLRIVPKGLRSFSRQDADFFLELLPGPRDAEGIPESLRFWKQFLETPQPETDCAVALLYGPSGCGKSSFLKAGLIPLLSREVIALYVEALPDQFEDRLRGLLLRQFPELPPGESLSALFLRLRDGDVLPLDTKLVLVFDQFEQWLQGHQGDDDSELVRALRHCDAARLQCLIAVRDDFGMAATQFMSNLEIPIVQGRNFATVDRFSPAHSRKVLADFGRAFGRLPASESDFSVAQNRFLDSVIESLVEEGRVFPVRLALLAEMIKDRPWVPRTLSNLGGAEGIGVAFLEETFHARSANPNHRRHLTAIRRVLRTLIPEQGADIRRVCVGADQLREATGLDDRARDFGDVLRILDGELRLITPVDRGDGFWTAEMSGTSTSNDPQQKFYQLTHDYLVPSIRMWLIRTQRESRRGRTALQLSEQAGLWSAKPVTRLLPSFWLWLSGLVLTHKADRTSAENRMMAIATRHYATVVSCVALIAVTLGLVASEARRRARQTVDATYAEQLVRRLLSAEFSEVPAIVEEIAPRREYVNPLLVRVLEDSPSEKVRLHAGVALLPVDPPQAANLLHSALQLDPERLEVLAELLDRERETVRGLAWSLVGEAKRSAAERCHLAALLARFDPDNPDWKRLADPIVAYLVSEQSFVASKWVDQFRPVAHWLIEPLRQRFDDPEAEERIRLLAAELLAQFVTEPHNLAELIGSATLDQWKALRPAIAAQGHAIVPHLSEILSRRAVPNWDQDLPLDRWPDPSIETRGRIRQGEGRVHPRWAMCQTMPRAEFDAASRELAAAGYRLNALRPFEAAGKTLIAAVWARDGREAIWEFDLARDEVEQRDAFHRRAGRFPIDIATSRTILSEGEAPRFTILWAEPPADLVDAQIYLDVAELDHIRAWKPLNERSYVPCTNLLHFRDGQRFYSSLRMRFTKGFEYADCWDDSGPSLTDRVPESWHQPDVRLTSLADQDAAYSSAWWDRGGWATAILRDETPDSLLQHANDLVAQDYRPATLSVGWRPGDPAFVAAAVWRRPVPGEAVRERLARAQANAALSLLEVGQTVGVWELFEAEGDLTRRSWLIHQLSRGARRADLLWNQLRANPSPAVRRGLLQVLAQSPPVSGHAESAPADVDFVRKLYRDDPDPGVHSAAEHFLRLCDSSKLPGDGDDEIDPPVGARWSQTGTGHTLAHIQGPVQFVMGSSPQEAQHESRLERQHAVRIPRSFAIGTKEVTVEQYLRFRPEFDYPRDYLPSPACPITTATYFEILQYCRWLSEQEQVPEDQMCYPPIDQIGPGMTVPADVLERTGYRLPTEAEWEFACRAGTTTARPFGIGEDLLPFYAWTARNSQYHAWPVARLLPNDLGLFDMLGNAMEFCQNVHRQYPRTAPTVVHDDRLDSAAFSGGEGREWRGGAFLYQPTDARSAHRDDGLPEATFPFQGFRIARTLPR